MSIENPSFKEDILRPEFERMYDGKLKMGRIGDDYGNDIANVLWTNFVYGAMTSLTMANFAADVHSKPQSFWQSLKKCFAK